MEELLDQKETLTDHEKAKRFDSMKSQDAQEIQIGSKSRSSGSSTPG